MRPGHIGRVPLAPNVALAVHDIEPGRAYNIDSLQSTQRRGVRITGIYSLPGKVHGFALPAALGPGWRALRFLYRLRPIVLNRRSLHIARIAVIHLYI
ncbi:hypothetical protein D3C71_1619560 [compost metagenome]